MEKIQAIKTEKQKCIENLLKLKFETQELKNDIQKCKCEIQKEREEIKKEREKRKKEIAYLKKKQQKFLKNAKRNNRYR